MRVSALTCGGIDPLGITSTMVYDRATNLQFALAEVSPTAAKILVSIDATTGKVRQRRPAPEPKGESAGHQQRGALTLYAGRVYIPYGGRPGDCGQYVGSVVALP